MSFPADHDRQLRSIRLFRISKGFESFDHLGELFINDSIELSLRDTVAVDNDPAWQRPLVFLVELKAFLHHDLQLGDHLTGVSRVRYSIHVEGLPPSLSPESSDWRGTVRSGHRSWQRRLRWMESL